MTEKPPPLARPIADVPHLNPLTPSDGTAPAYKMLVIGDPTMTRKLIEERQALGRDRHDEVWDGVYFMSPDPIIEHQGLEARLLLALHEAVRLTDADSMFAGVNGSDRAEGWLQNYRIPDLAIYLAGNPAQDCDTHWCGGPDVAVEIVSPGDRSREKLDFYAKVGTRELLIVDRDPWVLELYALKGKKLRFVGRSTVAEPADLRSAVLDLSLRLVAGTTRPSIEVRRPGRKRPWRA
jgi:Uma2 family endonuclease